MIERRRSIRPREPDVSAFPRVAPSFATPRAAPGALTVTWVGHATLLLQLGAVNVLTDPMWSERASPVRFAGPKRWVPPGVAFDALPPIDLVLLSHNHYDHLDGATVSRLARRCPAARWFVPLGLARFVRARGVPSVTELDWWDVRGCRLTPDDGGADAGTAGAAGAARVVCTPAQHFSARTPWDRDATLWCGWSVAAYGWRVFFGGDSGYHPEFARIAERAGPFDLVALPVGAYEPRWFMRPVHMDPAEAVRAYAQLAAPRGDGRRAPLVPIHWGTFKLTDEAMDEPPRLVRRAWHDAGLPEETLWLLKHGETRGLS